MAAFVLRTERARVIRLLIACNHGVPTLISTIQLQKFAVSSFKSAVLSVCAYGGGGHFTELTERTAYLTPNFHLVEVSHVFAAIFYPQKGARGVSAAYLRQLVVWVTSHAARILRRLQNNRSL